MAKKQRFKRAIEKRFQRRFLRCGDLPHPRSSNRVFPGIKLALPVAMVAEAEKCASRDARRQHPASAQSLLRFACAAAHLNYVTRSTAHRAQPFNEQGYGKKKAAHNFDAFAYQKAGSENGSCFRIRENDLAVR